MDLLNFYYLQRVLESELDLVETNTAAALKKARQDLAIIGMHDGGVVTQNAPPDLSVLVSGPALGTDPDGERLYWAAAQTVDCSQDHLGAPTTVVAPGNERWISVIAEYDQTLALPVTDGNGVTVYTRIYDSFNLYVTMAAEQAFGANVKPALPADGVLLADIRLVFGTVQILAADINIVAAGITNRRQDLVRYAGTYIPTAAYGNLVDAVIALFGYVDALSTGVGVVFAATGTWRDASAIAAVTVSGAINEIVSDLSAFAGAARMGSAAHVTVGGFCNLGNGAIQDALEGIADNVDGHIGGGAPAHPDTAVTSAAQAGTPESWAGGSVRGFLTGLLGHVNDRTERAVDETVSGAWKFENGEAWPRDRAKQSENLAFRDSPWFEALFGGSAPPWETPEQVCADLRVAGYNWAQAWLGLNSPYNSAGYNYPDTCRFLGSSGRKYVAFLADLAGFGTPCNVVMWFDPCEIPVLPTFIADLGAVPNALPVPAGRWEPTAMCSDGLNVYIMFVDPTLGAASPHRIQAFNLIAGTIKVGWPNDGTVLPGSGLGTTGTMKQSERCKVVQMSAYGGSDVICTLNSWVRGPVAIPGTTPCVSMINMGTGAIVASGCGDMPIDAVNNCWPTEALASDGTNVYVGSWNETTGVGQVFTCRIVNPQLGSATGTWPYQLNSGGMPAWACPKELLFDGALLWCSFNDGNSLAGAGPINFGMTFGAVVAYDFTADDWIPQLAAADILAVGHMAYDGLNVWVQVMRDMDGAGNKDIECLYKMPCVQANPRIELTVGADEQKQLVAYLMSMSEFAQISTTDFGRMCFDGDGVWTIVDGAGDGHSLEGVIRRVPHAGSR